jgi:hypothetical protein
MNPRNPRHELTGISHFAREERKMAPPENPYEYRDRDRDAAVSLEVLEFALVRGRFDEAGNPDFSGLVLKQAPRRDKGQGEAYSHFTYVVNQRVLTVQEQEPIPGKERSKETREVDSKVSAIDLDVRDHEGNVVAKMPFDSLDDFMAFLDSHEPREDQQKRAKDAVKHGYRPPGYLVIEGGHRGVPRDPIDTSSFRWGEERSEAPAELSPADRQSFGIDLLGGENNVLDRIFKDREQLEGVPGESLVGLTFMQVRFEEPAPGDRRKVVHKLQVTGDSLMYGDDPRGREFSRVWEITEFDEQGRQVKGIKRFYRDRDLKELFDNKAKGAWKDLTDERHQNLAHQDVPELIASGEWENVRKTSYYADPHWEIPKATLRETRQAAGILGRLATEAAGGDASEALLEGLKTDLANEYLQAAHMLRLRPSVEGNENPGETFMLQKLMDEPALRALLDGSHEARQLRRAMIDEAIGLAFVKKAMPEPQVMADGGQVPVNKNGFVDLKVKAKSAYAPNPDAMLSIQDFVKSQIGNVLGKIAGQKNKALAEMIHINARPDQKDLIYLGRLLRRQLVQ